MTAATIPIEAEHQNILRRGFRIIRPQLNPYSIELKNRDKRGWQIIETFDTLELLNKRLIELGSEEKTLIYNI
ncbi:MAG: hypothetical protein ACOYMF_05695 [Bacteroidales bacterium]